MSLFTSTHKQILVILFYLQLNSYDHYARNKNTRAQRSQLRLVIVSLYGIRIETNRGNSEELFYSSKFKILFGNYRKLRYPINSIDF